MEFDLAVLEIDLRRFLGALAGLLRKIPAEQAEVLCTVLSQSDRRIVPKVRDVFNRTFRRKWDDIRDFLAIH